MHRGCAGARRYAGGPAALQISSDRRAWRLLAGDLDSIKALSPVDATTNPSLILAAVSDPKFSALVDEAIKSAQGATPEEKVAPQQARAPAHTRAGALI